MTYSQIYIQIVFRINNDSVPISEIWEQDLHRYISAIINQKKNKTILVNGMHDHIHIMLGLHPATRISDLVREIKNNSSKFINDRKFSKSRFFWQEGYGVFSYSRGDVDKVYKYILNQKGHHKKLNYRDEYTRLLAEHDIGFNEEYI